MKKGFTLMELIVTIGLLGIIGLVIVSNMSGTLEKEQEKEYKNFKKTLENAACRYIDTNEASETKTTCKQNQSCKISLETVLKKGLIDENDLYNPNTKETISLSTTVTITYTDGIKGCSIDIE